MHEVIRMHAYVHAAGIVGAHAFSDTRIDYDSDCKITASTAGAALFNLVQDVRADRAAAARSFRAVRSRYSWDGGATVMHYPHHCRPVLSVGNQMKIAEEASMEEEEIDCDKVAEEETIDYEMEL